MIKSIATALVASATMLGTGAAHAGGHVAWSIGISAPVVGAVIGNAPYPYYDAAPVYAPAPPVYVAPVPFYDALPQPVYEPYYPRARYDVPAPVVYPYYRWHREWRGDERHERDGRGWDRHDGDRHDSDRHDGDRRDSHRH